MADYKKIMFNNTHMTETIDDVESTQVNSQVDKFSTDYTADKLNELYNEFDSITLDNSAIDTITQRNAQSITKVSARAKLYITAGCVIAALLLFLMIYNFFVISRMNNSINILQDDLTYQEYQVTDKARQVNSLTDEEVLRQQLDGMGYSEISSENVVALNSTGYAALQGESNWFDKFCGFIGDIFGG